MAKDDIANSMLRLSLLHDDAEYGFLLEDFTLPAPNISSEEYRWKVFCGLATPSGVVEWMIISTLCRDSLFKATGVQYPYEEWQDAWECLRMLD
jgi:hypothetical protein